MEKAIVVVLNVLKAIGKAGEAGSEALAELNQHLDDGWRVKQSCAMGGTDHTQSASLVILERDD